jgi:antitoxin (DNA-binding transcriptional repressor) of toxin-antitoxin stability system
MKMIGVFDAKTHLSELIDAGEAVTITKHGVPVATLNPIRQDPAVVVARIRANPCIEATTDEIVAMIRDGRP